MKTKNVILVLFLLGLSSCRAKVYWLPGTLETGGVAAQCAALPALSGALELKAQVDALVARSLNSEDPDELSDIAKQISEKAIELRAILTPDFTEVFYPVTYRFPIFRDNLPSNSDLVFKDFSIMGDRLFGEGIRIQEQAETRDVVLTRQATLLEICAMFGTVQGLYAVAKSGHDPKFFFRLFVNVKN